MASIEKQRTDLSDVKEGRKQIIIDVAEKLFLEKGLSNVSIQQIARDSRISRVTFYRYFSDIHPLAMEVAGRMMGEMYTRVIASNNWFARPPKVEGKAVAIRFFSALIDVYQEIIPQLKFMGVFDQVYAQKYPSDELADFYKKALKRGFAKSRFKEIFPCQSWPKEELDFFIAMGNIVFASLEKLASRGELLEGEQNVSIAVHLEILKQALRSYPIE